MNKISIIIPVYNSEKTISRCLESIISQTYKDIEILVINDGSIDKSIEIIKKYQKKDKRIKLINKQNEGVAKTRNLGIQKSTGKYIMFIDNDDYIENDYIESFIINIDYDIVIGGYKRINSSNKELYRQELKNNNEWSKYIILAPWAKLYKRDFLIKNKIEFLSYSIGEDIYFNLLCYSKTNNIKIINNVKYIWFYNDLSISNTKQKGLNIDISVLLNKLISFIDLNNVYNKYFLERYVVWYLLFSGKTATRNEFVNQYNEYKSWLISRKIKPNIKIISSKLNGEPIKIRISILMFRILERLNLINLFAQIYCKGD